MVADSGDRIDAGILALLSWRALAGTTAWRRSRAWAFALTVLYAATDELHQGLVAGGLLLHHNA